MSFNKYYHRICIALALSKQDVVEIFQMAGVKISVSRPAGWRRSESDVRRHIVMHEDEFNAFTAGLIPWARANLIDDFPSNDE